MALYGATGYDITGTGKAEAIVAGRVRSNFSLLGVQPLHGRVFLTQEDRPGSNPGLIADLEQMNYS